MEALSRVIGGLPADLDAAVLVVLHIAPLGPSVLPAILSRHGKLPARHALDGERLEAGTVFVAPPDRHLILMDGRLRLVTGPKENGNRPAADPLLRSVAKSYGSHGAGVILSGSLDDGTIGLAAVKAAGGLTIVQDPEEAAFPGMPLHALSYVRPDHVTPLSGIPALLVGFVESLAPWSEVEEMSLETDPAPDQHPATGLTCPDCGGALWVAEDGPMRFVCRVGHAYSPESLFVGKHDALEAAIWAAIVALEERADLSRRLVRRLSRAPSITLDRYHADIERSERGAGVLKGFLDELMKAPPPVDERVEDEEIELTELGDG